MKLSTAILLSVIAHIVLLLVFTNFHQAQPTKQIEDSQPIVTAQLIFTQPTPEPEPLPEPEPEPELKIEQEAAPQKERTQPTPEPVITAQQNLENPQEQKPEQQKPEQQQKSEQEQKTKQAQSTLPTASFDPYASLDQFINQQTSDFINNSSREQQQRNNAINNIPSTITSINSTDDSPIKEIFETAQRIDADTRVVNYNGRCVQIKRELDANGFSQFKWTGTTLDCGLNADMKAQLKQSLSKFLKK